MLESIVLFALFLIICLMAILVVQLFIVLQKLNQIFLAVFRPQTGDAQAYTINVKLDHDILAKELASYAANVMPSGIQAGTGSSGNQQTIQAASPRTEERDSEAEPERTRDEEGRRTRRGADEDEPPADKPKAGVNAVVCEKCGMENSTFRKICFNCNSPL
ncbi:zinc finger Ran-binding domain-containing protein [Marispirochaeta sp.]|jgi:hypothetical protein|uniref:zinc finger Ran-binding domain-containing protein n=1 Tax=Marispirochaeta sp. TaxID=2038653 RepID=UPI0029C7CD21|nr:zinc finger Ran-binding domain-containing protein [Marispirochaeta sp.]